MKKKRDNNNAQMVALKVVMYEEAVIPISYTMCNTYKRSLIVVKIAGLGCKNIVYF